MDDSHQNISEQDRLNAEGEAIVVHANYELFVLAMVLLQLVNSFLIVFLRNDPAVQIPIVISTGVVVFLLLDAFYRLFRAGNRRRYLFKFHGYLVFIGSLPAPFLVVARLIWYAIVTRRFRRSDYDDMGRIVVKKSAQTALLAVILAAVLVMEIGSVLIMHAESVAANANIVDAGDALWWALVTMATVGYGDLYPVTSEGRLVAVFVMIVGVGLFTVLTSYLAQRFLRPRAIGSALVKNGGGHTSDNSHAQLRKISALLDEQEEAQKRSLSELRARLTELENQLADPQETSTK